MPESMDTGGIPFLLPDTTRDTPLEAWMYGSTYLIPTVSKYMQYIDRINPMVTIGIAAGIVPAAPVGGSLMLMTRVFGNHVPEYFHRIGYDIVKDTTLRNNERLQVLLEASGISEFQTTGFKKGLERFRAEIASLTPVQSLEFPIPWKSLGVPLEDPYSFEYEYERIQYAAFVTDIEWVEDTLNTTNQKLPFLAPIMDSVYGSFTIVMSQYRDYIINGGDAPYQAKVFAKIIFLADASIYTELFRLLYDNDKAYRNPEFVAAIVKFTDLLVEAAYATGV